MPAFVLCLATVVAIGWCGGAASAQDSPGQSAKPLIDFPPSYKARIAALLVPDYLKYGEGQPEIGSVHNGAGPLGGSVSVCVQFSYNKKQPKFMFSDGKYKVLIFGERSVLTLGIPVFKRRRIDKCSGVMTPFRELERAGQVLKGCLAKGEKRCVVNQEPGRRDTVVVRTRSNQPAGPRLSPPD